MLISTNSQRRKGVNLQEFLAKREALLSKKEIKQDKPKPLQKVKQEDVEKKTEKIDTAKIKVKETTPITPILEKNKVFKFVQADKIRDPLKLLAFIEWLSIAPMERQLKTQQEFATKIGVNVDTLADWKKLTGFWDEVSIYRTQHFRKYTSSVYYGLIQKAKTGDPRAVELVATLFEGFKKGIAVEDITPERIITPEEKAKIDFALRNIGLASIIASNKEAEGNDN